MNISFAPIHECNFACSYCYALGGNTFDGNVKKFDKSTIDKLIDYVYRDRYNEFSKFKFDFVSGGEPLLGFDTLEYFLHQIRLAEKEYDKSTSFLVVTNATLLTKDILRR